MSPATWRAARLLFVVIVALGVSANRCTPAARAIRPAAEEAASGPAIVRTTQDVVDPRFADDVGGGRPAGLSSEDPKLLALADEAEQRRALIAEEEAVIRRIERYQEIRERIEALLDLVDAVGDYLALTSDPPAVENDNERRFMSLVEESDIAIAKYTRFVRDEQPELFNLMRAAPRMFEEPLTEEELWYAAFIMHDIAGMYRSIFITDDAAAEYVLVEVKLARELAERDIFACAADPFAQVTDYRKTFWNETIERDIAALRLFWTLPTTETPTFLSEQETADIYGSMIGDVGEYLPNAEDYLYREGAETVGYEAEICAATVLLGEEMAQLPYFLIGPFVRTLSKDFAQEFGLYESPPALP